MKNLEGEKLMGMRGIMKWDCCGMNVHECLMIGGDLGMGGQTR